MDRAGDMNAVQCLDTGHCCFTASEGGDSDSTVCLFLGQLVDLSLYFRVAFFKQPENNLPQHTDPSADLRRVRNSF